MTNCDPRIELFMEQVEGGEIRASREVTALVKHVRKCFETEGIYVDSEQLTNYLGLTKYFPYDDIFPWQKFVIGLHDCTYWRSGRVPRWPDLFCMLGRGAGKDGTIALESVALISPYNGIKGYDVDICANNEDQALRPVKDIVDTFENPGHVKKLKKFFKWTTERVMGIGTKSTILGRTNNPKGKDGLRSGIVIFNEIHQYEDYKNIDVFTTGLGKKKDPRRSYYTTQGYVREGPLDDLLETSKGILFGEEQDNGLLPFICKLDSKEEVEDEANWEKANPSLPYLPTLRREIEKEFKDWKLHPERAASFMTKRMNIPQGADEMKVTDYENIKATKKELPDLEGWSCTAGLDFTKVTDWASVVLHFKQGNQRYDLVHTWVCSHSADIPRIKAPWQQWADAGRITIVNEVEIHPELLTDYLEEAKQHYNIRAVAIDDFRYALMSRALREIGFDAKEYKNLKLVRPSDVMRISPVIDSCFANQWFTWGDAPELRWATNNTKLIRHGRKIGGADDADMGNFVYGKIEAKSRKTDPFMALVAAMTIEDRIIERRSGKRRQLDVITF